MFGGKREKALESDVARLKESLEKKKSALEQIRRQKDELEEQFAALAAVNAHMEKDLELAKEHLKQMTELSDSSQASAKTLREEISHAKEQGEKAQKAQDNFYKEVKSQNERVMEIVESNKHFTTPMKMITELPGEYQNERERLTAQLEQMSGLSKNMGVLALNAAIEAGRMGESGRKFIASAEEIRAFSEEYESGVAAVEKHLQEIDSKVQQLEEQSRYLNQLLKDNNVSMGKILKDSSSCILEYENHRCTVGQLASKGVIEEFEEFLQKETSISELESRMQQELSDMKEIFEEQKKCTGGMERAFEWIEHSIGEV